jgi:hypothetical protein
VFVDDNYHYMDSCERVTHGEFETIDAAVAACRKIVDEYLASAHEKGVTAKDLYSSYIAFGDDSWIAGACDVPFSAWTYAKQRCAEMCLGPLPDLDQTTSMPAERLAGCIGDKFESFTGGDKSVRSYQAHFERI